MRKRVFELRVPVSDLGMNAAGLLEVLQNVSDDALQPPFEEVKMWLGLDDSQELQPALAQLVQEFLAIKQQGS